MPFPSPRTKHEVLAQHLQECIARGDFVSQGRLPPLRQLARQSRCSVPVALAAVRLLKQRGIVEDAAFRNRYHLVGVKTAAEPSPTTKARPKERSSRSLQLASELRRSILTGALGADGVLPMRKELAIRFACAPSTLRNALSRLVKDGLLSPDARRIGRKPEPPDLERERTCLVGNPRVLTAYSLHAHALITSAEAEMTRIGWPSLRIWLSDRPKPDDPSISRLGFSGLIHWMHYSEPYWTDLIAAFPHAPLALIDLEENPSVHHSFRKRKNCIRFTTDNYRAGFETGRTLLALGHRRVAFLTNYGEERPWVAARSAGLEGLLRESGLRRAEMRVYREASGTRFDKEGFETIQASWRKFSRQFENAPMLLPEAVAERLLQQKALIDSWATAQRMQPVFKEALRNHGITAWVCVNDELAFSALAFLKREGVKVPEEISVTAFDNSSLAYRVGLSSYDFAVPALGRLAVGFLAQPRLVRHDGRGDVRVPGMFILRSTTAKARSRS